MSKFNVVTKWVAYDDTDITSNPAMSDFDWTETLDFDVAAVGSGSQPYTVLAGQTLAIFSSTVSTSVANDTEFDWALSALGGNTYRLTFSGVGTTPAFRTNRNLTNNGDSIVIALNSNATITMTGPAGAFTGVVAGDTVFIPGTTTGDTAGPFSALNVGYWYVLTASTTVLQLRRPTGTAFQAYGETVPVTADSQLMAFSAAGVQIGNTLSLSAGFSASLLKSFTITAVNPNWIEVFDTSALPVEETAVPTTSGFAIYGALRDFLKVRSDVQVVVQINGDTSLINTIAPYQSQTAWFERSGPTWSLSMKNTSDTDATVRVFGVQE